MGSRVQALSRSVRDNHPLFAQPDVFMRCAQPRSGWFPGPLAQARAGECNPRCFSKNTAKRGVFVCPSLSRTHIPGVIGACRIPAIYIRTGDHIAKPQFSLTLESPPPLSLAAEGLIGAGMLQLTKP